MLQISRAWDALTAVDVVSSVKEYGGSEWYGGVSRQIFRVSFCVDASSEVVGEVSQRSI